VDFPFLHILSYELKIYLFGVKGEMKVMAKDSNSDKGKKATSVTPQGYADTDLAKAPKSKLENAAKKKNTK